MTLLICLQFKNLQKKISVKLKEGKNDMMNQKK